MQQNDKHCQQLSNANTKECGEDREVCEEELMHKARAVRRS